MWLRLILEVALLALVVVSVASVARALVPKGWAQRKPLSCDVCMSFWVLVAVGVGRYYDVHDARELFALIPAHGLAILLLSRLRAPDFPVLEEEK